MNTFATNFPELNANQRKQLLRMLLECLPDNDVSEVVDDMEDFHNDTKHLHPYSNEYRSIERSYLMYSGNKIGYHQAIEDAKNALTNLIET